MNIVRRYVGDRNFWLSLLDIFLLISLAIIFDLFPNYDTAFYAISSFIMIYSSQRFDHFITGVKSIILSIFLLFYYTPESIMIIFLYFAITYYTDRQSVQQERFIAEIQDAVWNLTDDIMFVKDKNLAYSGVNRALEDFYQITQKEILGKTDFQIFPEEMAKSHNTSDLEVLESKIPQISYDTTISKGKTKHMMTIKQPLLDTNGNILGVFGISRDISELYIIRQQLEESSELLEQIFEYAPIPIFVKNLDSIYIKVNPAFAAYHGKPVQELEGCSDFDFFSDTVAKKFIKVDKEVLESGSIQYNQSSTMLNEKQTVTISVKTPIRNKDGQVTGLVGMVHDLTTFVEMESQIIESQKMDSVANIAAGFAHDLNNILTGVLGYASLLKSNETNEKKNLFLDKIISATNQVSELIRKLMMFSRQHKAEIISLNLNTIIENTCEIIKPSVEKDILFTFQFSNIPNIRADQTHINQMMMNLIINAVEAIPEAGEIQISTSTEYINDFSQFKFISDDASPGNFVKTTITDNGLGMPKDIQNRIFDPYFTTKISGTKKGTGLGLAIVYGVVTNMRGMLSLTSKENIGTSINIYFPAVQSNAMQDQMEEGLIYGKGTILCIDDQELIHDLLESMLQKLGYDMKSAYNGEEGIEIYQEMDDTIDCIILDYSMPGMSGMEVYSRLKSLYPDIKIILSTGYDTQANIDELTKAGIQHFLGKPYTIYELSAILDKVL